MTTQEWLEHVQTGLRTGLASLFATGAWELPRPTRVWLTRDPKTGALAIEVSMERKIGRRGRRPRKQ